MGKHHMPSRIPTLGYTETARLKQAVHREVGKSFQRVGGPGGVRGASTATESQLIVRNKIKREAIWKFPEGNKVTNTLKSEKD